MPYEIVWYTLELKCDIILLQMSRTWVVSRQNKQPIDQRRNAAGGHIRKAVAVSWDTGRGLCPRQEEQGLPAADQRLRFRSVSSRYIQYGTTQRSERN